VVWPPLLVPCASRKAWPLYLVHAAEQTNVTTSLLARIGMACNARGLRECNRGNEGEKHSVFHSPLPCLSSP
jgi:hypothetical protein